jgi:hypothetical protein
VITSSIAAPDLRAICRAALGRELTASEPIGAGRNSRVFRVDLDRPGGSLPASIVVKFYRRDAGDVRDRLATEFEGLRFLWQNSVRSIPCPIATDRERNCAIYEYIVGDAASAVAPSSADIDASVEFLGALKRLRAAPGSDAVAAASEACFSLAGIVANVEQRLARLRRAPAVDGEGSQLHRWIDQTFDPLFDAVRDWCRDGAARTRLGFDEPIGAEARTLSPSDFGFHNAIRRSDGTLAFVDFEYFGWDDPAKMIVDYLLHPGMMLTFELKHRFAARMLAALADVPGLEARTRLVYPLFGLKWAAILLNDFLPERVRQADRERRGAQLAKAQAIADRVAGEYAHNPYLG